MLVSDVTAQTAKNTSAFDSPAEHVGQPASVSEDSPVEELKEVRLQIHSVPKLNLGQFELKNLEPARALTSKIGFALHLTLPEDISPVDLAELERWQHRLREQVIIAVRLTDVVDFLDPSLVKFRRHILYRVNRLLRPIKAKDVLLADFTFSAS